MSPDLFLLLASARLADYVHTASSLASPLSLRGHLLAVQPAANTRDPAF